MQTRAFSVLSCALTLLWAAATNAHAAVIVLANETDQPVETAVVRPGNSLQAYRIAAHDVLPLPTRGSLVVRFATGSAVVDRTLSPNSIGLFAGNGQLDLTEQRFGGNATAAPQPPSSSPPDESLDAIGTFPVAILVDDDEPAVRRIWEARLRGRLQAASRIFERYCRMRFEVVSVGTWDSDDGTDDFAMSLWEFERKAPRKPPARLVIGFTSQYRKPDQRRVHLGGTRGPLYSHLLVREWAQHVSESERLEILVHELGHVLGASHSPDSTSAMRPLVGDRQARARTFRIGFDPLNTLALYVFCEQLRLGHARRLENFDSESRITLANVYREMDRQFPTDTAARRYLTFVERASQRRMVSDEQEDSPYRRLQGLIGEPR
jgi:hypothetical protein